MFTVRRETPEEAVAKQKLWEAFINGEVEEYPGDVLTEPAAARLAVLGDRPGVSVKTPAFKSRQFVTARPAPAPSPVVPAPPAFEKPARAFIPGPLPGKRSCWP